MASSERVERDERLPCRARESTYCEPCAIGPAEIFSTSIRLCGAGAPAVSCAVCRLIAQPDVRSDRLNYANLVGLRLFELSWDELICLPSRRTAEPVHQDERARLLETVTRQGYIDNYRGIRVSENRAALLIEQATVWNLFDESGVICGQAATFSDMALFRLKMKGARQTP